MKKFIYFFFLLIFTPFLAFPQWSTDPNNNLVIATGWDPHIVSDSAGGCYITYNYGSFYPQKLAVERLDKYGYKPWGERKQILGELPEQWQAEIIEDGEGGVIVSYEDNQVVGTDFTSRVRVQKIDSSGNFLWAQTGVRVTTEEKNHGLGGLVSDGEGGTVVILINSLAEYKVNRISSTGERMWGDSGIVMGINGYGDPPLLVRTTGNNYVASPERNTYKYFDKNGNVFYTDNVVWLENIISDGYGGIIISSRGGQWPSNWQLRAQRKDSLGNSLWQEPHIVVAESLYINTRNKITNNDGLYFFSWSGMKNGIEVIAQFQALRLDGTKLFPEGSISISNGTPLSVAGIIPSELNNTIFIWNDATISSSTIAQLYDTLGNKLWNENGVVVSYPAIAYQTYTTDAQGGFIIGGTVNEFTLVAQQVSKYGKLGEVITSITQEYPVILPSETMLFQNYPNPFNPSTTIKYDLPKTSDVSLIIYDILGRKVKGLVKAKQEPGRYEVQFDASYLSSGIYIYQLISEKYVNSKKMILLR